MMNILEIDNYITIIFLNWKLIQACMQLYFQYDSNLN